MCMKVHIRNYTEKRERERDTTSSGKSKKKRAELSNIRYIKSKGNSVPVIDNEIKETYKNYFYKLYKENPVKGGRLDDTYFLGIKILW